MRPLPLLLPALLAASLAIAVGLPALGYEFVYDDQKVVVDRTPFWNEGLGQFLGTRHWGTGRHATLASLDIDRLWLGGSAAAFHATNLLLSGLVSALVLALARRCGLSTAAAAAAACLFAVHPAHVDAVVSIVGRAELLAAAGVLTAVVLALREPSSMAERRSASGVTFAGCAAAAFLAFHSKENAMCLPGLLVLAWVAFPRRVAIVPALAGTGVALLAWAVQVVPLAGEVVTAQYVDNPLAYDATFTRIPKALGVLMEYARLMVWPHPLVPDRSFAQTDPSVAAGWLAAAVWTAAAAALIATHQRRAVLFFAIGWFVVAFAATSNIAFATGTVMAERLTYLPSVGACLAFGLAFDWAAARLPRGREAASAAAIIVGIVFFVLFRGRAAVWASPAAYFPASAAAAPRSAKAQYDLGLWLHAQDRKEESFAALERALVIVPAFSRASFYLAEWKAAAGDIAGGIAVYERYLKAMPDDPGALTNLTRLLLEVDRPREAMAYAQRLVALSPDSQSARNTLVAVEGAIRRAEREKAVVVSP